MGEWPLRTIGDLVTLQRGIDLPEQNRVTGNIPIMGSFGITGRHNVSACKGPGVTVGRSGASAGTVCYIAEDFWPLNTCLYVRDFKGNDVLFTYHFLKTIDLAGMNSGSAQPSLNRNFVHPMPVRFPELREQRTIAAILSALDDKIELNRRMNETLEASARALFRDWFVDFGPTRAKAEGRPAYLAPDFWSLFPDCFDEDGVPQGWQTYTVEDLACQHTASINPLKFGSEPFEHFSLPAFDSGQNPVLEFGSSIKSNKTLVPNNAILLSKLNPEICRVWLPTKKDGVRQIASTEFLTFVAKSEVGRGVVFALFLDPFFRQTLEGMVTGTSKSHQRISPPALRSIAALRGNSKTFMMFAQAVDPLIEQMLLNRLESRTLAETRDALLPKLMSGTIRVRDAESAVAALC